MSRLFKAEEYCYWFSIQELIELSGFLISWEVVEFMIDKYFLCVLRF